MYKTILPQQLRQGLAVETKSCYVAPIQAVLELTHDPALASGVLGLQAYNTVFHCVDSRLTVKLELCPGQ